MAVVALLCGAGGAPLVAQGRVIPGIATLGREQAWRWGSGAALGAWLAPGELGRDRNATGGHEELIARWSSGVALALQAGIESRFGGFEMTGVMAGSAVQVRNEFGVAFPNHGTRPFAWSANGLVYPLAPLQGRKGRLVRPFVTGGLGGLFLSVDLDNIKNQTLYHSFHWSIGGGVRIATSPDDIPTWTPTFVELRVTRFRVWPNGPLSRFDAVTATAGLGMRF